MTLNQWFSRQLLKVGSYFEKVTSIYLEQLQKAARHGDMCKAIISSTVTFASNNYKRLSSLVGDEILGKKN